MTAPLRDFLQRFYEPSEHVDEPQFPAAANGDPLHLWVDFDRAHLDWEHNHHVFLERQDDLPHYVLAKNSGGKGGG